MSEYKKRPWQESFPPRHGIFEMSASAALLDRLCATQDFVDVVNHVSHVAEVFQSSVGDGNVELILEFHCYLRHVQRIGIQIVDDLGAAPKLAYADSHLLSDYAENAFFNCHFSLGHPVSPFNSIESRFK